MAVAGPRSVEFIQSLLGILKAGGAYVPLALDHPLERQRFMLDDSGAVHLLASGPPPDGLRRPHVTVLDVGPRGDAWDDCSTDNPAVRGSRGPGVHHVHVRVYRSAKRSRDPASRCRPPGMCPGLRRLSRRRTVPVSGITCI